MFIVSKNAAGILLIDIFTPQALLL